MVGQLWVWVDIFVRVRWRCDAQTMRDPHPDFNGLYMGGYFQHRHLRATRPYRARTEAQGRREGRPLSFLCLLRVFASSRAVSFHPGFASREEPTLYGKGVLQQ
jgi:hypothetical protein